MEKLAELKLEELKEIDGGNPGAVWRAVRVIWTALEIQDRINEFSDGWRSVKC
jgi:hypothetical protein